MEEGQRLEPVHDQPLGHIRLGVRTDSRRSRPTRTRSTHSGLGLNVSTDGGKTFATFANSRTIHSDHHGLWIDPKNTQIIYSANDGGFYSTEDAGKTWKFAVSAGGAQFYNVAVDQSTPPWVYGSIQDIGSRRGRLDLTAGRDKIPAVDFENAPGGEGSHHAIDPKNPNIVYSHGFYGNFSRTDLSVPPAARGRRGQAGTTPPQPPPPPDAPRRATSIQPKEEGLRAQWMAPVVLSPHDPNTVYLGYQFVFRSTNRGDAWEKISADLTANDPKQMLPRSSSEIPYQTITALDESPRVKGLIYAGTDDGKLHVTADAGKTLDGPERARAEQQVVPRVVPSLHADDTGLRHPARTGRRRLRAIHLQVDRWRQDLHEHRRQHPGRARERDPRGSRPIRTSSTSAPTSVRSSRPTAASSGRCSAATCRPPRCRTWPTTPATRSS